MKPSSIFNSESFHQIISQPTATPFRALSTPPPQPNAALFTMAVKPITGMLKRGLVADLAIALGIGMTMGSAYWYGYHMPRTNARDNFYKKLEAERAARSG
ncbi:hypothetical protein F4802DRAFT_525754 [Xylaria palmicola]|nr:hypothetical protein F4802DRAFT_525754 [Xylaria palmicola]